MLQTNIKKRAYIMHKTETTCNYTKIDWSRVDFSFARYRLNSSILCASILPIVLNMLLKALCVRVSLFRDLVTHLVLVI